MDHTRSMYHSVATRGVNQQRDWIALHTRPVMIKLTDASIWSNFVRRNTDPDRKHWKCGYCKLKLTATAVDPSTVDITHRFKDHNV